MSIIYVMIPLALVLVALAVWALVWAIRSGQLDDLESHHGDQREGLVESGPERFGIVGKINPID